MRAPTVRVVPGRWPQQDVPNQRYPEGRVCTEDGCATVLSIYTGGQHCWVHEPMRAYVVRAKRGRPSRARAVGGAGLMQVLRPCPWCGMEMELVVATRAERHSATTYWSPGDRLYYCECSPYPVRIERQQLGVAR